MDRPVRLDLRLSSLVLTAIGISITGVCHALERASRPLGSLAALENGASGTSAEPLPDTVLIKRNKNTLSPTRKKSRVAPEAAVIPLPPKRPAVLTGAEALSLPHSAEAGIQTRASYWLPSVGGADHLASEIGRPPALNNLPAPTEPLPPIEALQSSSPGRQGRPVGDVLAERRLVLLVSNKIRSVGELQGSKIALGGTKQSARRVRDLMQAAAGVNCEIVGMGWDASLSSLAAGEVKALFIDIGPPISEADVDGIDFGDYHLLQIGVTE